MWSVGEQIASGGFGRVFLVESETLDSHVAKFIPKAPGARRELLFPNELGNLRNVVPVVDSGEWDSFWILIMPKAKNSLAALLSHPKGPLTIRTARTVLVDIAEALVSMKDSVVHRDIKPSNILQMENDKWCLADFGISKYAEATTATDTRKFAWTEAYAAPEQWRGKTATYATDVYSFGVVAYQLFAGKRPFTGPERHDYRRQHTKELPEQIAELPPELRSLVDSCLRKAPEARPSPATILSRLTQSTKPQSVAVQRLQEASSRVGRKRSELARKESVIQSERERKEELQQAAQYSYDEIVNLLTQRIQDAAAECTADWASSEFTVSITLGNAVLVVGLMSKPDRVVTWDDSEREVAAYSAIFLGTPPDRNGHRGRAHSLWYLRQSDSDGFRWHELAFEVNALVREYGNGFTPFSLSPQNPKAERALSPGITTICVAESPSPIDQGNEQEFVESWLVRFAQAAT